MALAGAVMERHLRPSGMEVKEQTRLFQEYLIDSEGIESVEVPLG